MLKTILRWVLPAVAALAVTAGIAYIVRLKAAAAAAHVAMIDAQNQLAARDTTRVIRSDSSGILLERLAFVSQKLTHLTGQLEEARQNGKEVAVAFSRLRLAFDSITAKTTGQVREDPAERDTRLMSAELDTAGIFVGVVAAVPPPPRSAIVTWNVKQDTTEILTSLTRGPNGQAFWRAQLQHGGSLRLLADSVVLADQPPLVSHSGFWRDVKTVAIALGSCAVGGVVGAKVAGQ